MSLLLMFPAFSAEDGDEIQQALGKFIGRRTVPQVFINGEHLGGSDGMTPYLFSFLSISYL